MDDDTGLTELLAVLDALGGIARGMHPIRLFGLIATLAGKDILLAAKIDQAQSSTAITAAAGLALKACAGLRAAPNADSPMIDAYRAMRHYYQALEALAGVVDSNPAVGRYFLEPRYRDDAALRQRLAAPPTSDTGLFHSGNEITERGGFSVYIPPWHDPARPAPLIFALHGGNGHGRLFLWNWFSEARSRGLIVVAPTAIGRTWSLMEPDIDAQNLQRILMRVQQRWAIDPTRMLLTGMSDGGTFTLLSGLADDSPFTHLAPVAASFHPMLLAMTGPLRLTGLPIHLTHGAQDWMFPVGMARLAHRTLASAGAAVTYREIADLSHAYPRDGQTEVLDWFLG